MKVYDVNWTKCIAFSSDNASVMMGKNNSIFTRIAESSQAQTYILLVARAIWLIYVVKGSKPIVARRGTASNRSLLSL